MILYFKKYKDTANGTNWAYDEKCLAVDNNFANLKISLPERKVNVTDIYGQGAIITPTPFFTKREISFTYRFKKSNDTIFTTTKDELFLNWFFNVEDDIYLVRNTDKGLQKIKGIFKLNAAEKYKSYAISDEVDIDFVCEDAFFTSTTQKQYEKSFGTSDTVVIDFINEGFYTSFVVEYNNSSYAPDISFYYEDEQFKIYLSESQPKNFIFDFKTFKFYKNNINFFPQFAGSPFFLKNGAGQITVKTAGKGSIKIIFEERWI